MDQGRSPLGTQHHQPPPPSLESENETVDVESVSADVSSVSVDQSPLPMALPSHLDIEDDKQMDSTVLRQIMNIVISLQPNQGAICDRHKSLSGCYGNDLVLDTILIILISLLQESIWLTYSKNSKFSSCNFDHRWRYYLCLCNFEA